MGTLNTKDDHIQLPLHPCPSGVLFDKLDQDGDGEVTQEEVLAVLQALGFDVTEDEVKTFMDNYNNVDYETFVDLSKNIVPTDDDIANSFLMFDKNGNESIDLSEITSLLALYDLGNAGAYLEAFDQDENGELDFQEYKEGFYQS